MTSFFMGVKTALAIFWQLVFQHQTEWSNLESCGSGAATFRTKQVERYPLPKEKELKNEGRRSYDYRFDFSSGLHVIKWYDNKCVHLASTLSGVAVAGSVRDRK